MSKSFNWKSYQNEKQEKNQKFSRLLATRTVLPDVLCIRALKFTQFIFEAGVPQTS